MKKRALVIGMGKSGNASLRFLAAQNYAVDCFDSKTSPNLDDGSIGLMDKSFFGGKAPEDLNYDLVVIAPGVPPSIDIVLRLKEAGIPIIGEVELAYRGAKGKFVAITGTNGKTTTSTWVHDAFVRAGKNAYLAGNVGIPLTDMVRMHDSEDVYYITELSSYQLESISSFSPYAAAILNLTPDHLQRHGNMKSYGDAKWRIQENLRDESMLVLNSDDEGLYEYKKSSQKSLRFSLKDLSADFYMYESSLYSRLDGGQRIVSCKDIFLKGRHNIENALAVLGLCRVCDISIEYIAESLRCFRGVAHRNEYVCTIGGVDFYNDSKATNPEAAIPALLSTDSPIILIAGGMDKGSDYRTWVDNFKSVKKLLLLGETKLDIADVVCEIRPDLDVEILDDLDSAFKSAVRAASSGDTVLLSPACASWDMYDSFEVRGDHFKKLCQDYGGVNL